jgi:CheY-like chemotaxis protein
MTTQAVSNKPHFFGDAARAQRPRAVVLVAEDHEDTRLMLRLMLEYRGLGVVEAGNGAEAVDVAERERPDLVLLDGSLPSLDGFDVTRRIRRSEALSRVPIVFLSGHAEEAYQDSARDAGCDEFMIKPLDTRQLDRILERHLGAAPVVRGARTRA